jgi:hypothetical protein
MGSCWIVGSGSVLLGLSLGTLQIITLTRFAALGNRLGRGRVSGITPLVGTCGGLLGNLLGGGALGPVSGCSTCSCCSHRAWPGSRQLDSWTTRATCHASSAGLL